MRALTLVAFAFVAACAPSRLFRHGPTPNKPVEAEYAKAVAFLAPDTTIHVDSAIALLDAYLAYTGYVQHRDEAAALRHLAGLAQRLGKVEEALKEARASSGGKAEAPAAKPDDETVKEVQRLKDELAKANAELERIKKRLATPRP